MKLDLLFSDYYKVLSILYDNQTTIGGDTYCPLSQEEMAKELDCTRMTISNILRKLREEGYIEFDSQRKYKLNEKSRSIVGKFKNIERKV